MTENIANKSLPFWQQLLKHLQERPLALVLLLPVLICGYFFWMSAQQLSSISEGILTASEKLPAMTGLSVIYSQEQVALEQKLAFVELETLSNLESYVLQRRYHQANVLLLSRVWIRYLGFIIGLILSLMGALIIATRTGESPPKETTGNPDTEATAKIDKWEFIIKTSSQGLILVVFGTALMMISMLINHQIEIRDVPTYTNGSFVIQPGKIVETGVLPQETSQTDSEFARANSGGVSGVSSLQPEQVSSENLYIVLGKHVSVLNNLLGKLDPSLSDKEKEVTERELRRIKLSLMESYWDSKKWGDQTIFRRQAEFDQLDPLPAGVTKAAVDFFHYNEEGVNQ